MNIFTSVRNRKASGWCASWPLGRDTGPRTHHTPKQAQSNTGRYYGGVGFNSSEKAFTLSTKDCFSHFSIQDSNLFRQTISLPIQWLVSTRLRRRTLESSDSPPYCNTKATYLQNCAIFFLFMMNVLPLCFLFFTVCFVFVFFVSSFSVLSDEVRVFFPPLPCTMLFLVFQRTMLLALYSPSFSACNASSALSLSRFKTCISQRQYFLLFVSVMYT